MKHAETEINGPFVPLFKISIINQSSSLVLKVSLEPRKHKKKVEEIEVILLGQSIKNMFT